MVKRLTISFILAFFTLIALGQTNFRTNLTGGGNWDDSNIWEIETPDGSGTWVPAGAGVFPTSANNTILISDSDIVTITADLTIDQTTVGASSGIIIDPGVTVIINAGTGTDMAFTLGSAMVVYGRLTLNNTATIAGLDGSADVFFEDGSFYRHLYQTTEGLIPVASWATTSTLEIFGYTASAANLVFNGVNSAANWGQTFGNVLIDCPLGALRSVNFNGLLTNIQGTLTITRSTAAGTGWIQLANTTPTTMMIGGNFEITGNGRTYLNQATDLVMDIAGDFNITTANTNATRFVTNGTTVVNVAGDFNMNAPGVTINLSQGSGPGTLNLSGDFNLTAGTVSEGSGGFGEINFVSNEPLGQNFTNTGTISNQINYSVAAGSTLNMGTSIASGTGTFTASGNLRVGWILNTTGTINTGTSGNIRVTGTRTYDPGITIEFNGTAAQLVGNAFPQDVNVVINNSNGVTLSATSPITIADGMNLEITAGSTLAIAANTLTLNGTISGTGTITGGGTSNLTIGGTGSLGTLHFTPATTLNNVTINRVGDAEIGSSIIISGTLTQTDGDLILSGSTLTINGAFSQAAGNIVLSNDPTIVIGGTGALPANTSFGGDLRLNTLTVNRTGTFATNSSLLIVSQLNLQNGTFDNQGAIAMLTGSTLTRTAGSLTSPLANFGASEPFNIVYSNTAGISTGPEIPSVLLDPQNSVLLNNLTKQGSGLLTLTSDVEINGVFTLTSGTFGGGANAILMRGNLVSNAASTLTAVTAQFGGTTVVTGSVTPIFGNVNVLSGASLTPNSTFQINGNLVNDGTLNAGSGTTIFGGTTVISGSSTSAFNNVTITSPNTLTSPSNASILVAGNWVNNGTFTSGILGTVEFNGNTNISGSTTTNFLNIRITGVLNSPAALNVGGNFTDDGTFNAGTGAVVFNGSSIQNIQGSSLTTFNNMNITNTTGGPPGVRIQTNKNIRGILTLSSDAIFDADGSGNTAIFTLLSTDDAPGVDAAIAALAGAAQVTGNVTVQRFMSIEGGSNSSSFDNGRIYRYISSPVQIAAVSQLQPELPVTGSFTGTSVCSGCGTAQSMFAYNEAVITDTNGSGGNDMEDGYIDFPNASNTETLQTGKGYALFVRGNIAPVSTNGHARWDVRNVINSGVVNFTPLVNYTSSGNNANDGWNLVGNPYPSTIDWDAATGWTKTGLNNTVYMRDNGSNPIVYATFNATTDLGTNDGSRYIPLGQAFFVKSDGGPIDFQATEAVKSPGSATIFFRETPPADVLRIALRQGNVRDETVIHLYKDATDQLDKDADTYKLRNGAFNLSSVLDDGTKLAINSFPGIDCGKTVKLDVSDVKPGSYELYFSDFETFNEDVTIMLRDAFTGSSTNVRNATSYTFAVTNDSTSFGAERFSIVLSPTPVGDMAVTVPSTACLSSDVTITLPESQKGYSYSVLLGDQQVASAEGNGKIIDIIIPHEKLSIGNNLIKIEGQSLVCENVKVSSQATILVEEVQQATIVVVDENTLVSSSDTGNSWYLNGTLLAGKTGQYLDVEESGVYKLVVTKGACSSSADREFTVSEGSVPYAVYPNPLEGGEVLTIRSGDENLRQVSISNSIGVEIGQVTLEKSDDTANYVGSFDLNQYPSGLYFVKIRDGNKFRTVKIISLK